MGATFDLFAKVEVNGDGADPVWKFLKEKQVCLLPRQSFPTYYFPGYSLSLHVVPPSHLFQGGLLGSGIKWNFTKFVVDQEGRPVARVGPMNDPIPAVEKEVEKLLK